MRRTKPQPIRNKIDPSDPAQIRAWTRRLGITPDDLKRMIGKVGNSIAAINKEIELQKPSVQIDPASIPVAKAAVAEVQLTATGS
jgi:predicted RNA-binding protein YlqC (UPF0109 family)